MSYRVRQAKLEPWRLRLREIIFGAETRAGKAFDVILLLVIACSVVVVMLDSVATFHQRHAALLYRLEWGFTILFTVEYLVRLWCVDRPRRYAFSFFGVVDFLGVIPTYLSLFTYSSRYLVAIRFLRVLRVFRVLKLASYDGESRLLVQAFKASRRRIVVFLLGVLSLIVVLGSLMYVVEGGRSGFTSIPTSIYWAIVTMTTVGYGDISPITPLGQGLAALIMLLGYSLIVVPTGIVSVAAARPTARHPVADREACGVCGATGHEADARFCRRCGRMLAGTHAGDAA